MKRFLFAASDGLKGWDYLADYDDRPAHESHTGEVGVWQERSTARGKLAVGRRIFSAQLMRATTITTALTRVIIVPRNVWEKANLPSVAFEGLLFPMAHYHFLSRFA